jgi:FKBP-type peptidyl-prolyl cis-trans isomerase FkpA
MMTHSSFRNRGGCVTLIGPGSFSGSLRFVSTVGCLLIVAGCGSSSPTSPTSSAPYSQTDLIVGTGAQAVAGRRATVAYTGWLYDASRPDGKGSQFDSSASFAFVVGAGQVIRGWDQGVPGMRVGGQRRLVIPPELAYGSGGSGPIPPNATLVFDIGLLNVQ